MVDTSRTRVRRKDPVPTLDSQLCFALYRASRAMTRAYAPLLEPLGITYPQYLVLLALWQEDGVPVRRLGELLELDSATLTPLLKRLENQDMITRTRCSVDERVVRIHLTETGKSSSEAARAIPRAIAEKAGADTRSKASLDALRTLKEALDHLTATLTPNDGDRKARKMPATTP